MWIRPSLSWHAFWSASVAEVAAKLLTAQFWLNSWAFYYKLCTYDLNRRRKVVVLKGVSIESVRLQIMTSSIGATPSADQDYYTEEVVYTTSFEVS